MLQKLLLLGVGIPILLVGCVTQEASTQKNSTQRRLSVNGQVTQPTSTTEKVALPPIINVDKPQATSTQPVSAEPPFTLNLLVPFVPQAPYQVWDALHNEACEEAAMITVDAYFKHTTPSVSQAEQAILSLVKWEHNNGYAVDLTAQEVADILQKYFGLSAFVSADVTVEHITQELSDGNLIIVPAAGRLLGNPNYRRPGPIYHMLVLRGYDARGFITNDPGTRKGEGYWYGYETVLNAVHDWNHELAVDGMTDEEISQGRKAMIVIVGNK